MNYFVTGAGNFVDTSEAHKDDVPSGALKFHWADIVQLGGFAFMEATNRNLTFTFVNGLRKPLYSYTLYPRH